MVDYAAIDNAISDGSTILVATSHVCGSNQAARRPGMWAEEIWWGLFAPVGRVQDEVCRGMCAGLMRAQRGDAKCLPTAMVRAGGVSKGRSHVPCGGGLITADGTVGVDVLDGKFRLKCLETRQAPRLKSRNASIVWQRHQRIFTTTCVAVHEEAAPRRRQSTRPPGIVLVSSYRDAGAAMAATNNPPSRPSSRSVSSQSLPSRRASPVVELSPADKAKEASIAAACRDRDLAALVQLATSKSGLVSDSARRTACTFPRRDSDSQR